MKKIKTIKQLLKYLNFAEKHYLDLSNFMFYSNSLVSDKKLDYYETYYKEHLGKVKFIRLLKFKLTKG